MKDQPTPHPIETVEQAVKAHLTGTGMYASDRELFLSGARFGAQWQARQGWVDVKTPPENSRDVLVTNDESDIVKMGFYNQSGWYVYESANFETTHWRELPEGPKQ